eukprot:gene49074-49696_t
MSSWARTGSPLRDKLMKGNDDWAKMCMDDVQAWNQELRRQRSDQRDRMREQRIALDVDERKQQQRDRLVRHKVVWLQPHHLAQEQRFAEEEQVQRALWGEGDAGAAARRSGMCKKRKDACIAEQRLRDEQLSHRERALGVMERSGTNAGQEKRRAEEAIAHAKMKEEEQLKAKKERVRHEVKLSIEYNEQQKAVKQKQQHAEAQRDDEHQPAWDGDLRKQEQEREDGLRKIYARQSKQSGLDVLRRAKEDGARADAEAERQLQKLLKEEDIKARKAKTEQLAVRKYLAVQIEEKEQRRHAEVNHRNDERHALLVDIKDAEEEEQRRRKMRKERDLTHRKDIEQQITRKNDYAVPVMTEAERKLNTARLQRVQP